MLFRHKEPGEPWNRLDRDEESPSFPTALLWTIVSASTFSVVRSPLGSASNLLQKDQVRSSKWLLHPRREQICSIPPPRTINATMDAPQSGQPAAPMISA
jgi:hypothetical protein